jgi:hypothetical protein
MDIFKEWKSGDWQKKLRSGVHQEVENEVDLNWADGIRGLMGEKGLPEEDRNDRSNWSKNII